MESKDIIDILKKYGLHLATKRELSLFTLSIITLAYTKLLKKEFGFSYEAIAAIGGKNKFHTLFNEQNIAKETEKLIESSKSVQHILDKANGFFNDFKKGLTEIKSTIEKSPENFLNFITEKYQNYMLSIGLYNCFLRYLGNEKIKGRISSELIKKISKEREIIAKLYLEVEKLIQLSVHLIGKKNNFDGDLLRYLTLEEIKLYLSKQKILSLEELKQRRDAYFYLFFDNREYVFVDRNIIKNVHDEFFKIDYKGDIIMGHCAYPGLVKGVVKVISSAEELSKIEKGDILIASMTAPNFVIGMDKAAAFVTDEGGILCHATIVSREMKKPCIIGTKVATKALKDGDIVEVDATKGMVKIVKRK